MFGHNKIVGKQAFADSGDKLLITSLFFTLQGEGPLRGEPAFFVRLTHCSLSCSFCDTYFDKGTWYGQFELETKINTEIARFFKGDVPEWATLGHRAPSMFYKKREMALVVTGGEPMLQENIVLFLDEMQHQFEKTQIETNGAHWQPIPDSTILVCSPKCFEENGVPIRYLHVNKRVLERANCLKFVMAAGDTPYASIPDWAHEWHATTGRTIYCSPMNIYNKEPEKARRMHAEKADLTIEERSTIDEVISFWEPGLLDMEANKRNHEHTARYAIEHGFTFGVQLHLLASVA